MLNKWLRSPPNLRSFLRRPRRTQRRRTPANSRTVTGNSFSRCFKYGKLDHIVKKYPLLKEEQEAEQFRKQAGNSSARRFSKAMLAAWEDSTEEGEGTKEEDAAIALMAKGNSDSNDQPLDRLAQLKDKVRGLNKAKLKELLFTLMDECDVINSENCMLNNACSELKKDIRELEHENKILKSEKIETDMTNPVLHEDLKKYKETLTVKEEAFATDLTKLENESLELK